MFSRGILGLAGTRGQAETTTMHAPRRVSGCCCCVCPASSRAFLPYIVNSSFESLSSVGKSLRVVVDSKEYLRVP